MTKDAIDELGGWDTELEAFGIDIPEGGKIAAEELDLESLALLSEEEAANYLNDVVGEPKPPVAGKSVSTPPINTEVSELRAQIAALKAGQDATIRGLESKLAKFQEWKRRVIESAKTSQLRDLENQMGAAWENGDQKTAYELQKSINELNALKIDDEPDDITEKQKQIPPSVQITLDRLGANGGVLNGAVAKLLKRNEASISDAQRPFLQQTLIDVVSNGHVNGWSDKDILIEFARQTRLSIPQAAPKTGGAKKSETEIAKKRAESDLERRFNALPAGVRKLWKTGGFDRAFNNDIQAFVTQYEKGV